MSSNNANRVNSLGTGNAVFLLVLLPLFFTLGVRYITAQHYLFQTKHSVTLDVSHLSKDRSQLLDQVLRRVSDRQAMKPVLPFFSKTTAYKEISMTNENFDYQLPLVGSLPMKYIRSKEEMMSPARNVKLATVGNS